MNERIQALYSKNCVFDKLCDPAFVYRTYESGVVHLTTQCQKCGNTFGSPISKKTVDKSIAIPSFNEVLYKKFCEEYYRPIYEASERQKKLNDIRKTLKIEFYKKEFDIDYTDFDTFYKYYLTSDTWLRKRETILKRDNYNCRYCSINKATQVHHLSYDNLGNETELELISVCGSCHQLIHNIETDKNFYDKLQNKMT